MKENTQDDFVENEEQNETKEILNNQEIIIEKNKEEGKEDEKNTIQIENTNPKLKLENKIVTKKKIKINKNN